MDVLYPQQQLKTTEILLVGFDYRPDYMLNGSSWDEIDYQVEELNNSFQAFQWLADRSDKVQKSEHKLPVAVICSYDFLENDNFLLLESIKADPILKLIPFIAVADKSRKLDVKKSLKSGIDDCYTLPVEWDNLRRRIEFLRRYKSEILSYTSEEIKQERFKYKIPFGKRLFDIGLSLSLIILFSPILLLIALLIKIESRGPIVYRSKRVGTGYQVFDFLKFRSMVPNADKLLKDIDHLNHYSNAEGKTDAVSFKKFKNDPRITRIGKIIRKTSLDELPQLFNVLSGQMSVVGNRPLPLYEAEQVTKDEWINRFSAPAGITGLWQTSGKRKDTMTSEERIALDLNYAEDYSFWMDITILSRTLPAMIQREE